MRRYACWTTKELGVSDINNSWPFSIGSEPELSFCLLNQIILIILNLGWEDLVDNKVIKHAMYIISFHSLLLVFISYRYWGLGFARWIYQLSHRQGETGSLNIPIIQWINIYQGLITHRTLFTAIRYFPAVCWVPSRVIECACFSNSQQERFNPSCKLFLFNIYVKSILSPAVLTEASSLLRGVWRGWEWGFGVSVSYFGPALLLTGCDLTGVPVAFLSGTGGWRPCPPSVLLWDVCDINELQNHRHVGGINQPGA